MADHIGQDSRSDGTLNGRVILDQQRGTIKIYDESSNLIIEIGKIASPAAGDPKYQVKLGSAGQIRIGDNLVITNNKMKLNDGANNRIIFGALPDGTIGLAISKVGINVEDAFS